MSSIDFHNTPKRHNPLILFCHGVASPSQTHDETITCGFSRCGFQVVGWCPSKRWAAPGPWSPKQVPSAPGSPNGALGGDTLPQQMIVVLS